MEEQGLNSLQKEAVLHTEGPLLIIAGAGTGKTRTLTHRIARLISSGVPPESILAVTFTNKAAHEMRERIARLIKKEARDFLPFYSSGQPFMGTFHALSAFILRRDGAHIGVRKNFRIQDRDDALARIKEAMRSAGIDPKEHSPRQFQSIISRQKGELSTNETYTARAGNAYFFSLVADVWRRYDAELAKENCLDFDDLLAKTVSLLKENERVREAYTRMWRYVHIDEYQDTNAAQYELVRLLAQGHGNIAVVGDGDQTIYGWRGANVKNILRFEEDYPGAKTILLEENYRSTGTILAAANDVIAKNTLRTEKNLFTKNGEGEKISLSFPGTETSEARGIADITHKLLGGGASSRDIAVLYRTNFQSRALEEAFLSADIPYHIIGTRFFERREVKDVLSFIEAAKNRESIHDIKRIINVPPRGIGKVTFLKLCAGQKDSLSRTFREKIDAFYSTLDDIENESRTRTPSGLVSYILERTGLETHLKTEEDGAERILNIRELASFAARFDEAGPEEGIREFLAHAALASDQDALLQKSDGVRLMTVHAAKGLEFGHVFIAGLEQGLFPYAPPDEETGTAENNQDKSEEERRLFYVALTRAKKKVFLSCPQSRMLYGSRYATVPSEFLGDIKTALFDVTYLDENDAFPSISIT